MPDENEPSSNQELNSWKEIASHLERGVRTVQRWESELGLPVRRTGRGKRGAVYALVSELDLWRVTSGAVVGKELGPGSERAAGSAVEESRRLMTNIQSMLSYLILSLSCELLMGLSRGIKRPSPYSKPCGYTCHLAR